ncbi:MAG TPA: nucleoside phosphorylase [Bacteroidales bacterium]|nr:nucleoside phosphorylase [Bacteroidales bacterium]HPF03783.1 nucleoside phosphorylase [Bacteroidales bacterium]HPJ58590.1 nucleoside phosphorylase [Bacteroidales bacterium]HPR11251.1 nucleoside phosphorylase [Bacteroidales bacterium]HRW86523.1 nucleoside phosphorylase [Bacteroidales bacterium]
MQKETELITSGDGAIFHLNLYPDDISDRIIIVGDPGRVDMLSELLSEVRVRKANREFKTVTGSFDNSGEITIISSGIGTDNIDILINELDALVNIDLKTGKAKEEPVSLTFIRLGTSGGIRADVPAGSVVLSETAVGFDGLLHFYEGYDWLLDTYLSDVLVQYLEWPDTLSYPYAVNANRELVSLFSSEKFIKGITISAPGFYAPQGRELRLRTFDPDINRKLAEFSLKGRFVANYEMESSAIYGLAGLLGHKALTLCLVIGNRVTGEFIKDYKPMVKDLALKVLQLI